MFKIGEFSKLTMLTVKTLRFYEKEGLLLPAEVDPWTGYRFYTASQLETAAVIKSLRQLDFTVEEIRAHLSGVPLTELLATKEEELTRKKAEIDTRLSIINYLLEEKTMKYQAVLKELPACIVYSEERKLERYSDVGALVLGSAEECLRLNPGLECVKPDYSFCEYLDGEYRERDMTIRYSQAVTRAGKGNHRIQFRTLPTTQAVCIYHKGPYENLGEAYAYVMNYCQENGYQVTGFFRECYHDGIWNKPDPVDWLTEIQVPVERGYAPRQKRRDTVKLSLYSDHMEDYLVETPTVDYCAPEITALSDLLWHRSQSETDYIRRAYTFVRDEIPHSADSNQDVVTCTASQVLREGHGTCFAKSHLLAALLRCRGIPTGFCYQTLLLEDDAAPVLILHGLNGVYLREYDKWIRLDARGNKPGVNARFSVDTEHLAFPVRPALGERALPVIYAEPDPAVVRGLKRYTACADLWENLPAELDRE